MIFQFKKRELWDRMLPFLANPIERIVYTDSLPDEVFCISGVNALSEYSMLNKEKMTLMPLQKKKLDGCKSDRQGIWRDPHRDMALQSMFFSKNGIVDKLSLFLAMKDMDDERIQIELETMINNMIW